MLYARRFPIARSRLIVEAFGSAFKRLYTRFAESIR
jgi:hypothetical protein